MWRQCAKSTPLRGQVRYSAWNFQNLMESRIPEFKGRPNRSSDEVQKVKAALPKIVFTTSYEYDLLTKPRSNIVGEYAYQRDTRLKVAELFLEEAPHKLHDIHLSNPEAQKYAELKALQNLSEYAGDLLEHQMQNVQRINDFVDSNPVYLLEQPLREEARWNLTEEMENRTRAAVRTELRNFLPKEYQQVKAADLGQVAAFSAETRQKMLATVDEHAAKCESEISAAPAAEQEELRAILAKEVAASKSFIDPTYAITSDSIAACSDLVQLREMAHQVADYNGDQRMIAILEQAAKVSGDSSAAQILAEVKEKVY